MNNKTEQIWDGVWQTGASGSFITRLRLYYNSLLGRLILPHVSQEGRTLELGCGTAQLSLMIAPHIKEAVGLDISSEGLLIAERERVAKGVHNVRFVKADVHDVPFESEFDVVWSAGLIEHFFDRDIDIVKQHLKAAATGGVVIMSVPYAFSLHSLHYLLTRPRLTRRFWPWSQERFFQKFYSKKDLLALGQRLHMPVRVYFLRPWFLGLLMGIIVLEIEKRNPTYQK